MYIFQFMIDRTPIELFNRLSDIARNKLKLVPDWIEKNYPQYHSTYYEVVENGVIALTISIGGEILLKIFVPKYDWIVNYHSSDKPLQSYELLSKSRLDFTGFGILKVIENDDIFQSSMVVVKYYKGTEPLINRFYNYDYDEKVETISKLVEMCKKFNRPVWGYSYSTQRILDNFDHSMKVYGHRVPKNIIKNFNHIRSSIQPRICSESESLHLVHTDISLTNILIDQDNNLHLIDFDLCHFAPLFTELESIFVMCFIPAEFAPLSLKDYYSKPMPEVWGHILHKYPELWNPNFEQEIKLMIATKLISRFGVDYIDDFVHLAYNRFFVESDFQSLTQLHKKSLVYG